VKAAIAAFTMFDVRRTMSDVMFDVVIEHPIEHHIEPRPSNIEH